MVDRRSAETLVERSYINVNINEYRQCDTDEMLRAYGYVDQSVRYALTFGGALNPALRVAMPIGSKHTACIHLTDAAHFSTRFLSYTKSLIV